MDLFYIMCDFLHSILKWQYLNRIQIDRISYPQLHDRNASRKSYHIFERADNKQSYCADNFPVWFVSKAGAYKSTKGARFK